jgi:hypothetical protein
LFVFTTCSFFVYNIYEVEIYILDNSRTEQKNLEAKAATLSAAFRFLQVSNRGLFYACARL